MTHWLCHASTILSATQINVYKPPLVDNARSDRETQLWRSPSSSPFIVHSVGIRGSSPLLLAISPRPIGRAEPYKAPRLVGRELVVRLFLQLPSEALLPVVQPNIHIFMLLRHLILQYIQHAHRLHRKTDFSSGYVSASTSWPSPAASSIKLLPGRSESAQIWWALQIEGQGCGSAESSRSVTLEGIQSGSWTPPRVYFLIQAMLRAAVAPRQTELTHEPMRAELDQHGPNSPLQIWCWDDQQTAWQLSVELYIGGAAEICSIAWGIFSIGHRRGEGSTDPKSLALPNPSAPRRSDRSAGRRGATESRQQRSQPGRPLKCRTR